ncbi:26S proteasome non-ATPase regulatory subunit 7 [Populus alba x Populus x berolinensis]|nr:26S proteasome non-ATPase regulatory subunit 7 [Populus alba x Populus x berolinensis]
MDVIKTQQISAKPIEKVIVHPLVLLSIVDNYNRVAKDTRKRVVGVLLGSSFKGTVDVTNSYAVPFEEDDKDPSIWFLDHNYHESMFSMFKRINAKEHVVGWYSTGPKLRENDLKIHGLFNERVGNTHKKHTIAVEENATQKKSEGGYWETRSLKRVGCSTKRNNLVIVDLDIEGKLPINHEILYPSTGCVQPASKPITRQTLIKAFADAQQKNMRKAEGLRSLSLTDN